MRLIGVIIPDKKRIDIALTYIYGVGRASAKKILMEAKIPEDLKVSQLKTEQLAALKDAVGKQAKIEGELRREIMMNVRRLRDIGSWRGSRHAKRLPARGQRTRTNMRTIKGNVRRTMGSGRKPAASPT